MVITKKDLIKREATLLKEEILRQEIKARDRQFKKELNEAFKIVQAEWKNMTDKEKKAETEKYAIYKTGNEQ